MTENPTNLIEEIENHKAEAFAKWCAPLPCGIDGLLAAVVRMAQQKELVEVVADKSGETDRKEEWGLLLMRNDREPYIVLYRCDGVYLVSGGHYAKRVQWPNLPAEKAGVVALAEVCGLHLEDRRTAEAAVLATLEKSFGK